MYRHIRAFYTVSVTHTPVNAYRLYVARFCCYLGFEGYVRQQTLPRLLVTYPQLYGIVTSEIAHFTTPIHLLCLLLLFYCLCATVIGFYCYMAPIARTTHTMSASAITTVCLTNNSN
jgi:hypothetical protein